VLGVALVVGEVGLLQGLVKGEGGVAGCTALAAGAIAESG